jgi:hypothetical protein
VWIAVQRVCPLTGAFISSFATPHSNIADPVAVA